MGKFILFAMIAAGFMYQDDIKKEFFLIVGGSAAKRTIEESCKMRASCEDAMKPHSDRCVEKSAVAGVERGMDAMKRTLLNCLSRSFMEKSCKEDDRCVAAVSSEFDTCWDQAYPPTISIDDSSRGYVLRECIQSKARRY